jgi:hypothetical protein
MIAFVSSKAFLFLPIRTIAEASAAKINANSRPIPDEAPVTRTVLFLKDMSIETPKETRNHLISGLADYY